MNTTLDQRRAAHALKMIRELATQGDTGHYVSYSKALPATILQIGLGQALATLLAAAKGDPKDPHHILFDHLNQWLCHSDDAIYEQDDVIEGITSENQRKYILAQAEALAYLRWLKKFAVAYLNPSTGDHHANPVS